MVLKCCHEQVNELYTSLGMYLRLMGVRKQTSQVTVKKVIITIKEDQQWIGLWRGWEGVVLWTWFDN